MSTTLCDTGQTTMHIPRIYLSQPLAENTTIELEPAAAHHIATVMRMKVGRSVIVFNGQAHHVEYANEAVLGEFTATLAYVSKKSVAVAVGEFFPRKTESSLAVELGACLIKPDRMSLLLQKTTELGVSSITPLWSDYTDIKIPAERLETKYKHWQQVIISACEQSERVAIPTLHYPKKLSEWVGAVETQKKIILHPYQTDEEKQNDTALVCSSAALLVGPEGGLSDGEVEQAIAQGFSSMMLGPRILRAETAPLAALTALQLQYGDFS